MKTVIGIIGGGQLGKMIAQEARRMSVEVIVLDPTPDCPAATVAGKQIAADFKDAAAIQQLAQSSDVITYEIESGNTEILLELERQGHKIFPSAQTLRVLQDKISQKEFLQKNGVAVPEFVKISSFENLAREAERFGYPCILKLRKDAYDGKGNFALKKKGELQDLGSTLSFNGRSSEGSYYLEKFVSFKKEVSVMVARNRQGQTVTFPVAENIHQNHILLMTIAPARVADEIAEEAKKTAVLAVERLNGIGIFGVEMFIDSDGKVLVNEIAPRPHNSGHYTIEACDHSQFELHLRAILNHPLTEPRLLTPAVMLNILGNEDSERPYRVEGIQGLLSVPGINLHLYGKKRLRRQRKLGHITITDSTIESALRKAEQAQNCIRITSEQPEALHLEK